MTRTQPFAKYEVTKQMMNDRFQTVKNERELAVTQSTMDAKDEANHLIGIHLDNVLHTNGLNPNEGYDAFIKRQIAGPTNSADNVRYGDILKNSEITLSQNIETMLRTPQKKLGGKSYYEVLPKEEYDSIITQATNQLRRMGDYVSRGEYSLANQSARTIKGQVDDEVRQWQADPKIGLPMIMDQAITRMGGDNAWGKVLKQQLLNGLNDQTLKYYNLRLQTMASGQTQDGSTPALKDAFNSPAMQKFANYGKGNDQLIKDVNTMIQDPQTPDEMRKNLMAAAYGQGNQGFIEGLKKDPADSRLAKFTDLTSSKNAKVAYENGQVYPQSWTNYTNWTQQTAKNLLGEYVAGLNDTSSNANVTWKWNPETMRFNVISTPQNPGMRAESRVTYEKAQLAAGKINTVLTSIKNVAGQDPKIDVESFLMKSMMDMGWKPGADTNIQNLPSKIAQSVIEAKQAAAPSKPAASKPGVPSENVTDTTREEKVDMNKLRQMFPNISNYDSEPDTSVSGWVNNLPQNKKVFNYSDEKILGIQKEDIPPNMTAREFHEAVRKARANGSGK
jgi:hypothetical protein